LTKVIIVSPKEIHDYFTESYAEWDTQIPVETIDEMWSGLQQGTLSTETSLVIFSDAYLENYESDLATAIATFAPEALVLVLFYDQDNYTQISRIVEEKSKELGLSSSKFYPINTMGEIGQEIYDAFLQYEKDISEVVTPEPQAAYVEPLSTNISPTTPTAYDTPITSNKNFSQAKRGLIIASTSSKGGSGKTTVAICTASMLYHSSRLAYERGLRENPLRVVIVDMDTRDGQIGFLLGQSTPTALNILLASDKTTETIRENLIYDERLGVHALLAPKRAKTADYLTPEFYQDIIQKLSTMFDIVILDTSVNYLDPLLGRVVLPIADAIMFVTNLSIGSVYGMNRWMDEVTSPREGGGSGIPKEKIGVVVNQSAPDMGIDQELLKHAAAGAELLVAIPLDTAAIVAASNHNKLSDIVLYHQDISPAYFAIGQQLLPREALVAPLEDNDGNVPPKGRKQPQDGSRNASPGVKEKKRKGLFGR